MVSFIFFHTLCLHHHEGRSHHWWPTAPLTSLQKPADVCKMIGLCSSDEGQQEKLLQYLVQEAVQSAATAESVSLTGRTSNGSFVWFNISDLMSSTVNRVSPPPTVPSASSWSRLWISSSPKTGLRSVAAMSRNPNSQQDSQFYPFIFLLLSLQEAVIHLLEEICRIMPPSHRKQCESVISTFSKTILDAILSYASPQAVCSLLHQCRGQGAPLEGQSAVT